MADAKKPDAADGEGAPKKKSKLLLIIVAAVLVVVLGGGAALFLMKKNSHADEEDGADGEDPPAKVAKAKKKKKGEPAAPPVFTKLEPFVVKLQSDQQDAYVQAIPELKLLEASTAEEIKQFMPEIRHKLLLILASKNAAELGTPEGMQKLANQFRVSINATLTGEKPDPALEKQDQAEAESPVQAVFFSSLIVQ